MNNNRAKSFVTIMIAIAFIVLSLRVIIEKIIKLNIAQNESNAQTTLRLISAAMENYSDNNRDSYPSSLSSLTQAKPQYLDKDYVQESPVKGYNYACSRLEPTGYACSAQPFECNLTGNAIYKVTTGGLFSSEGCSKKEEK